MQKPSFEEILNIQFDKSSVKTQMSYGLKYAKSFWASTNAGVDGYFHKRNQLYKRAENLSVGIIDEEFKLTFKDQMGVDADGKSWNNLNFELLRILPKYVKNLVGSFMNMKEKPKVSAIDALSNEMKSYDKQLSKYRMMEKERIAQMEQASGQKLEEGFTPNDDDELELYYKLKYLLPEEMFFAKTIEEVFNNSDYQVLKRLILGDLIKKNMACTKIIRTPSKNRTLANQLKIRWCKPDRVIHNIFESPVGRDIAVIGEAYSIDIADARKMFQGIKEEDWYKLAMQSSKGKTIENRIGEWKQDWASAINRPYDTYKFDVFDFEVKVVDVEYLVSDTNEDGNETLVMKKGKPAPQTGEVIEDVKLNIYCGTWAIDTDIMLCWEKAKNIIRPYQNGVDCFFNYSIVYPDANGKLVPSMLDRSVAILRDMILCALKIQQMMLEMVPDGIMMDIAGLHDLDIGLGEGNEIQPMEIKRIYKQTGDVIWDSGNTDGVAGGEAKSIPFQRIPNGGNAAQINTLIGVFNFYLARLNDEWGTNPDALGQAVPSRRSVKVNENLIQTANLNVDYIYDHFAYLMEENAKKLAMMLWDKVLFESNDYKQMEGMDESLTEAYFDVNIEVTDVSEDRQRLQSKIDYALQKGTISLGQTIRLENMENTQDAELYLIKLEKTAEQQMAAAKQQDYENNAALQQQVSQGKAQADAATVMAKAQAESILGKSKADDTAYLELVKMVTALQIDAQANGKPLSEKNIAISNAIITSIMQKQEQLAIAEQQQEQAQLEEQMQEQPEQQMA